MRQGPSPRAGRQSARCSRSATEDLAAHAVDDFGGWSPAASKCARASASSSFPPLRPGELHVGHPDPIAKESASGAGMDIGKQRLPDRDGLLVAALAIHGFDFANVEQRGRGPSGGCSVRAMPEA